MQEFINRQFFNLTLFTLIFGVMLYDTIGLLGFTYVDEICAALLFFLFVYKVIHSPGWAFYRLLLVVLGVFLFYLVYSLVIATNVKSAIFLDFFIQLKPYLAFCCVYAIKPEFNASRRKLIRQVIALCCIYTFVSGFPSPVTDVFLDYTFGHASRLATASTALALLYLYCSNYTRNEKIIFVLILSIGLLSTRSKHYGFTAFCTLLVFFINDSFNLKWNTKNVLFVSAAVALTLLVSWKKIYFYFITGGFGGGRAADNLYARMALYFFSTFVLMDFIPFGPGFGTYATYASATYYSPIYVKYGMQNMHGMTKDLPAFISDTYYPALAQFGFVGVLLFFWFWGRLGVKALRRFQSGFRKEAVLAFIILVFFLIECTSDSTITHNRGIFILMILGLVFSDMNPQKTPPVEVGNSEQIPSTV